MSMYFSKIRFQVITAAISAGAIGAFQLPLQAIPTIPLNGAGATWPAPLYERYIKEFKQPAPNVQITYQAIGSGSGIKQFVAGAVDFGGSDAAMTDDDMKKVSRGTILVPTAGGAIAVIYQLPGVSNLKLSQIALAEIFMGKITQWNNPKITKSNPGVNLPALRIQTVVKGDSSGTTWAFTNHLATINSDFNRLVGRGTAPKWITKSLKGKGCPGIGALVKYTPGSIGYVEFGYAKAQNMPTAAIQNRRGEFVLPSAESTNEAIAHINFNTSNRLNPNSRFRVFEGNPAQGYPIISLTWLMIYKQYPEPQKAETVKRWMRWILTEGQTRNGDLDYARIPSGVAAQVLQVVETEVKP